MIIITRGEVELQFMQNILYKFEEYKKDFTPLEVEKLIIEQKVYNFCLTYVFRGNISISLMYKLKPKGDGTYQVSYLQIVKNNMILDTNLKGTEPFKFLNNYIVKLIKSVKMPTFSSLVEEKFKNKTFPRYKNEI